MTNRKGLLGIAVIGIMIILIGASMAYLVLDKNEDKIELPVTLVNDNTNLVEEDPIATIRQIQIDENDGEPVINKLSDIDNDVEESEVEWGELVDKNIGLVEEGEAVYENFVGYCVGESNPVILVTSNHNYYDLLIEGNDLVIRNFDGSHPSKETVTVECDGVETDFMLTTCIEIDYGFDKMELCGE